jgi:hypothetical protein
LIAVRAILQRGSFRAVSDPLPAYGIGPSQIVPSLLLQTPASLMPVSVAEFFRAQFHPFVRFTSSGSAWEANFPWPASGIG